MKFAGFALLAAGLAFVFHAYTPNKFDTAKPALVHEPEISVAVAPRTAISLPRNFSIDSTAALRPEAARNDTGSRLAAADVPVVSVMPRAVAIEPPRPVPATRVVQAATEDTADRGTMVRRIKRELRRVGCYDGRIDGEWDRTSRAAMSAFVDRVNASLPSQEPDVVLLNLVRNHQAVACGATCPSGQAMDGDGRCLPNAIIAMSKRKTAVAVAHNAPMRPFTTTVTVNEMKPTAATLPPPKPPVQVAVHTQRPAPLPGRMTVGGPGTTSATAVTAEKSWWDNFIGTATETRDPPREQTLDRPVGLTQVPQPRLVRQSPAPAVVREASLEAAPAGDGTGDGTALAPAAVQITGLQPPKASGDRAYRKASRSKSGKQRSVERRYSGRNVQAMFQHPLGRM